MLRFAPSPTGDMTLSDLRIALLNYLAAKERGEPFLVRMDDLDKTNVIEGKDTEIMQILEKFAITHDQVYHQSEHLRIYQTLALRLIEEEKAFVCTCDPKQSSCSGSCETMETADYLRLKESGESFVIRIKQPTKSITFDDLIHGEINTPAEELNAFTILRADATPTPDFATACDDMLSDISLVIRDEKHLTHTPQQEYIKHILGYDKETVYIHLPAILDEKGEEITLLSLLAQGFIPDAIINALIALSCENAPKEIFYLPEAVTWFSLESVTGERNTLDMERLREINREHLRSMDDKLLSTLFGFADADIGKLAKLYLDEAATINELAARIRPILAPKHFEGECEAQMRQIQKVLIDAPMFETFEALAAYVTEQTGLSGEDLATPLRLLLTGEPSGPELASLYPYIRSYLLEVIS